MIIKTLDTFPFLLRWDGFVNPKEASITNGQLLNQVLKPLKLDLDF